MSWYIIQRLNHTKLAKFNQYYFGFFYLCLIAIRSKSNKIIPKSRMKYNIDYLIIWMRMRMHFPIPCRSFICVYLSIFVYFKMFCTFFFIKILIKSKMINVYCSYCIFLNALCDAHCCFDMHAAHLPELCVAL